MRSLNFHSFYPTFKNNLPIDHFLHLKKQIIGWLVKHKYLFYKKQRF